MVVKKFENILIEEGAFNYQDVLTLVQEYAKSLGRSLVSPDMLRYVKKQQYYVSLNIIPSPQRILSEMREEEYK